MSPARFHDGHASANVIHNNNNNALCPPSLKIKRDSQMIKKPSSSSCSSSSSSTKLPQRRPVIIYAQPPKIIHTHPQDFMALVQRLTGKSKWEDDGPLVNLEQGNSLHEEEGNGKKTVVCVEDNESSSVVTDENIGNRIMGDGHVNDSCAFAPIDDPKAIPSVPDFAPNRTDLWLPNERFQNYTDSLIYMPGDDSLMPLSSFTSVEMDELLE